MKTLRFWAMALCAALALASCKKDEVVETITVDPVNATFSASASTQKVSVVSNGSWTVSFDADWFTVSPTSGTGNGTVTITVKENVAGEGQEAASRQADVTFTIFKDSDKNGIYGGSDVLKQIYATLSVIQAAEDGVFDITNSTIPDDKVSWKGATYNVELSYNMPYTVESSASWATVVETKSPASASYTVTVDPNESNEERTATIKLDANDGSLHIAYKIDVLQEGKPQPKPLPDKTNALSGVFSVNSWGKTVKFSQGNLYWDGIEYAFEDSQMADTPTGWSEDHVTLFYWSSTADNARAEEYVDDGVVDGEFFANTLSEDWTTLSEAEWNYLLENHKYNRKVKIDGAIAGCVIAPDGITEEVPNSYTADEWAAAEKNGYVLLPRTGERDGSAVAYTANWGYYWSKSKVTLSSGATEYAMYKFITDDRGGDSVWSEAASYGYGIRLVTVESAGPSFKALSGTYTIDDAGTKVEFAAGNLYWDGSALKVEDNQWSYPMTWDATHVGHFYGGPNLSEAVVDKFVANTSVDYTTQLTFVDPDVMNGWFMLTQEQWQYIVDHNLSNIKKQQSYSCVNGVKCALIASDAYTTELGDTDAPFVTATVDDGTLGYTADEFASIEAKGVLALPIAGYRNGTTISSHQGSGSGRKYGYYCVNTYNTSKKGPAYLYFNTGTITNGFTFSAYGTGYKYGYCIRLARIVK